MLKYGLVSPFFDVITLVFLFGVGTFVLIKITPGQKIKSIEKVILILLGLAWLLVWYGSIIEPRLLTVTHRTIEIKPNTGATKIALVADLHVGIFNKTKDVKRVVAAVNKENPDVVVLLGDFIAGVMEGYEPDLAYLEPLRDLKAERKYAVLGNHDYSGSGLRGIPNPAQGDKIAQYLRQLGIDLLINTSRVMFPKKTSAIIAGVDDTWANRANLARALQTTGTETNRARVLITHNPDIILEPLISKFDLVLASHTHGGQIRLPFLGPLPPLPTHLGRHYDQGYFETHGTGLFITRGIGATGPRARLFALPEIVILEAKL